MTGPAKQNAVIVVAAGAGERLGADLPKAFVKLGRSPMLRFSLEVFEAHPGISQIVVVVPQGYEQKVFRACRSWGIKKLVAVVAGGARRQDSVLSGVLTLDRTKVNNVLIHDAARPLVSPDLVTRLLNALRKHPAVIPVVPLKDTPKELHGRDQVRASTHPRERYLLAQTPQAARLSILLNALQLAEKNNLEATDDAMLLEQSGADVQAIMGDDRNLKITTRSDLVIAKALLRDKVVLE